MAIGGLVFFVPYIKEGEEESAFVLLAVSSRSTNEIKNVSNHLNRICATPFVV